MSALKLSDLWVASAFSRTARKNCRKLMRPSGRRGWARTGNSLFSMTVMVLAPSESEPRTSPAYSRLLRLANRRIRLKSILFAEQQVAISRRPFCLILRLEIDMMRLL